MTQWSEIPGPGQGAVHGSDHEGSGVRRSFSPTLVGADVEEVLRWLPYSPFLGSRSSRLRPQNSVPRAITPSLSSSVRTLVNATLTQHRSRNPVIVYTTALVIDENTLLLCIAAQKAAYTKATRSPAATRVSEDLDFSFIFKDVSHINNLLDPDWQKTVRRDDAFARMTTAIRGANLKRRASENWRLRWRGPTVDCDGEESGSSAALASRLRGPLDRILGAIELPRTRKQPPCDCAASSDKTRFQLPPAISIGAMRRRWRPMGHAIARLAARCRAPSFKYDSYFWTVGSHARGVLRAIELERGHLSEFPRSTGIVRSLRMPYPGPTSMST
ncbi:hypothetical protein B0H14DRAFT_2626165 [Mycena olivaceomarginata]|nr:hypothetical protein B0H14DRAFT_2626165 [Mycena olivaceomarginata]